MLLLVVEGRARLYLRVYSHSDVQSGAAFKHERVAA